MNNFLDNCNIIHSGQYIAVIGGTGDALNDYSALSDVEVVKISDEGVVSLSNCNISEFLVGFAAQSNNLICGGFTHWTLRMDPEDATNQCKELDTDSLKWKERSPMQKKRSGHTMTTANNQTRYVCGGEDENDKSLKSCEKLEREWSFIKDIPIALGGHCMIGTEEFIYLIGGYDRSGVSK